MAWTGSGLLYVHNCCSAHLPCIHAGHGNHVCREDEWEALPGEWQDDVHQRHLHTITPCTSHSAQPASQHIQHNHSSTAGSTTTTCRQLCTTPASQYNTSSTRIVSRRAHSSHNPTQRGPWSKSVGQSLTATVKGGRCHSLLLHVHLRWADA